MPAFLFRCPTTGMNVQCWVANDPTDDESYEAVACPVCSHVHLVNPKTSRVIGEDDDE